VFCWDGTAAAVRNYGVLFVPKVLEGKEGQDSSKRKLSHSLEKSRNI
jgi:hypothetical protein